MRELTSAGKRAGIFTVRTNALAVQARKLNASHRADDGKSLRPYAIRPGFAAIGPARRCQWIEGQPTPDDSCKCLAPSVPGVSYCPDHARRAFRAAGSPSDFPTISPTP